MTQFAVTIPVDKIDDKATGQKVRDMRQSAGLSLGQVATAMEIGKAYLSDLELGRRAWTEERAESAIKAIQKLEKGDL